MTFITLGYHIKILTHFQISLTGQISEELERDLQRSGASVRAEHVDEKISNKDRLTSYRATLYSRPVQQDRTS